MFYTCLCFLRSVTGKLVSHLLLGMNFLVVTCGGALALAAGPLESDEALLPVPLSHCESMLQALYSGRLPLKVDSSVERRSVFCTPAPGERTAVWHNEHLTVNLSNDQLEKVKGSMQRQGANNALVQRLCQDAAHRDLLQYLDLVFVFHHRGATLATVAVSPTHCKELPS
jgi:hypothetical protein